MLYVTCNTETVYDAISSWRQRRKVGSYTRTPMNMNIIIYINFDCLQGELVTRSKQGAALTVVWPLGAVARDRVRVVCVCATPNLSFPGAAPPGASKHLGRH